MDISAGESAEHAAMKNFVRRMLGPAARLEVVIGATRFDVFHAERKLLVECQASLMSGDEFCERCHDAEDAGLDLWWVLGTRNYHHVASIGDGLFLHVQDLELFVLNYQGILLYPPWPLRLPLLAAVKAGDMKRTRGPFGYCGTVRFHGKPWLTGLPPGNKRQLVRAWDGHECGRERREREAWERWQGTYIPVPFEEALDKEAE